MRLWVQLHLEGSNQSSFRLVDIGLGIGLRRMFGFFFLTYSFLLTFLICSLHTILSFVLKNIPSVPNGKYFKSYGMVRSISGKQITVFWVMTPSSLVRLYGLLPVYHYLKCRHSRPLTSWEANWFAASQEIPRISRNPKVHYRTHKLPPTVSILGQPNPVHIPTSHLLEIHPNIIHPSTPRSPQWFFPSGFPTNTLYTPLSSSIRATCPANLILLDFITHTILGWGVQII